MRPSPDLFPPTTCMDHMKSMRLRTLTVYGQAARRSTPAAHTGRLARRSSEAESARMSRNGGSSPSTFAVPVSGSDRKACCERSGACFAQCKLSAEDGGLSTPAAADLDCDDGEPAAARPAQLWVRATPGLAASSAAQVVRPPARRGAHAAVRGDTS